MAELTANNHDLRLNAVDDRECGDVFGQVGEMMNIHHGLSHSCSVEPCRRCFLVLVDRGGVIAQRHTGCDGQPCVFALFQALDGHEFLGQAVALQLGADVGGFCTSGKTGDIITRFLASAGTRVTAFDADEPGTERNLGGIGEGELRWFTPYASRA